MKNVHRFWLLNKRLLMRPIYIILLLLIPLLVILLKVTSADRGRLMTVGICGEAPESSQYREILATTDNLIAEFEIIQYDSLVTALADLDSGTLQEVWFIPENFGKRKPATMYLGERNVTHLIMKEMLESCIFRVLSDDIFEDYVAERFRDEGEVQPFLDAFYDRVPAGTLFSFAYLDGETDDTDYMVAPVRGILAILLLVISLAGSIFYIEDETKGLFVFWSSRYRNIRSLVYYWAVLLGPSVLTLPALFGAGLAVTWWREIINLFLYVCSIILFANLIRLLVRDAGIVGIVIPFVTVSCLLLSPIFVDITGLRALQLLTPSYHYLNSIHSVAGTMSMLLYSLIEVVLIEVIIKCSMRRTK